MSKIKQILAIFSVLCLLASFSITCFAATARTPKANGQNKSLWCWATAAKVVGEHNGGSWISTTPVVLSNTTGLHSYGGTPYYGIDSNGNITADGVQRNIVVYIFGDDGNNSGNDSNKESALSRAAYSSVSVGTFGTYKNALTSSQIQTVKNNLANGDYLIGNLNASGFGSHSVVIKSYNSSTDKYQILDPWDLTDTTYSSSVFTSENFPIAGCYGRISWIQYCN